jgi:hypothetical protein
MEESKAMALTQLQADRAWERMAEAEVRSLYFADLAARFAWRKRAIMGFSFLLSSGAAATLAAKMPDVIPLIMAGVTALLTAYSIASGIDKAALTMSKLHSQWNHLAADYERLWSHWYEDDAEQVYESLVKRAREASELGSTEAPYNEKLLEKWRAHVYQQYEQPQPA